jgi:hypothetical protein
MVLIRYSDGKTHRYFNKILYYEDSVWGREAEAEFRKKQLEDSEHFGHITEQKKDNVTQYVVWSSKSYRRGTRSARKRGRRKE